MQAILAVDTKRAGELLSLSPRTVQRLIRSNRIRVVRTDRRVIIPMQSLQQFLQVDEHPNSAELSEGEAKVGN